MATTPKTTRHGGPLLLLLFLLVVISLISVEGLNDNNTTDDSSNDTSPASSGKDCNTATPDLRLPKTIVPVHYDLRLQPLFYTDDPADFSFKAQVSILIRCVEATDKIVLHSVGNQLDNSTLTLVGASPSPSRSDPTVVSYHEDLASDFLVIQLSHSLQAKEEYVLSMSYVGALRKETKGGFILSSFKRGNRTNYSVWTTFEPNFARYAFPCFDEPGLKATFNVTMVRKADMVSFSNMDLLSTSSAWLEDGVTFVADTFSETFKMSTYLVAFAVGDFVDTSAVASDGVRFRVIARPELKNTTSHALSVVQRYTLFYEKYFETKYPLPKQDLIAIPSSGGAMENWGLITFAEDYLLYDPAVSSDTDKVMVTRVVAHELAHQWTGDLVSPAWWNNIWLNEGFADFMQILSEDSLDPSYSEFKMFGVNYVEVGFSADSTASSHPVNVSITDPHSIYAIMDEVTYKKGSSLLRMLRHFLGYETFRKGLVNYIQKLKFGVATNEDLWDALGEQAKAEGKAINVKDIMDTWTLQMNYPVVTVSRDFNDLGLVQVSQKRFLSDPLEEDPGTYTSPYGYQWSIPLTLTSSVNPDFEQTPTDILWMYKDEPTKTFNLGEFNLPSHSDPTGWILANTQVNGFYRVNYQTGNWRALIHQLNTDHTVISAMNRAQLISDAWALVKPGLVPHQTAFDMVDYLDKELEYVPWQAADAQLKDMATRIALTPTYGYFQRFMQEKTASSFKILGFNTTNGGYYDNLSKTKIATVACTYGLDSCVTEAKKQHQAWMKDSVNNKPDRSLASVVYCMGVKYGGWKEWQFNLKMYKEALMVTEKTILLASLSCSREPWILSMFLNQFLQPNSPIPASQFPTAFLAVSSSAVGRAVAWRFFRENYDAIVKRNYPITIGLATTTFNTESDLAEMQAFMAGKEDPNMEGAVADVTGNIQWLKDNYDIIARWFSNKYAKSTV